MKPPSFLEEVNNRGSVVRTLRDGICKNYAVVVQIHKQASALTAKPVENKFRLCL